MKKPERISQAHVRLYGRLGGSAIVVAPFGLAAETLAVILMPSTLATTNVDLKCPQLGTRDCVADDVGSALTSAVLRIRAAQVAAALRHILVTHSTRNIGVNPLPEKHARQRATRTEITGAIFHGKSPNFSWIPIANYSRGGHYLRTKIKQQSFPNCT